VNVEKVPTSRIAASERARSCLNGRRLKDPKMVAPDLEDLLTEGLTPTKVVIEDNSVTSYRSVLRFDQSDGCR